MSAATAATMDAASCLVRVTADGHHEGCDPAARGADPTDVCTTKGVIAGAARQQAAMNERGGAAGSRHTTDESVALGPRAGPLDPGASVTLGRLVGEQGVSGTGAAAYLPYPERAISSARQQAGRHLTRCLVRQQTPRQAEHGGIRMCVPCRDWALSAAYVPEP